jgi:hypothetical protein
MVETKAKASRRKRTPNYHRDQGESKSLEKDLQSSNYHRDQGEQVIGKGPPNYHRDQGESKPPEKDPQIIKETKAKASHGERTSQIIIETKAKASHWKGTQNHHRFQGESTKEKTSEKDPKLS